MVGETQATAGFNTPRRFIRHTADVPIEVRTVPGLPPRRQPSINVSEGGLSFVSDQDLAVGTTIEVHIPEVDPPFEAQARVVWRKPQDDGWCIGVQFLDEGDTFRARMVEQVCSIERYRRQVEVEEGRTLTRDEAAGEWIRKYGSRFPRN